MTTIELLGIAQHDGGLAQPLTSFLLNDTLAIDGGSFGLVLPAERQVQLKHVILTHGHLDHILSLPIGLIETYALRRDPLNVYGLQATLDALRIHLSNDEVWLDLTKFHLRDSQEPMLRLSPIEPRHTFELEGFRFTAIPVHHPLAAHGLIVESPDGNFIFTSDTGPTEELWKAARALKRVDAVFIDCSYPNDLEALAIKAGHLTPNLVLREISKLDSSLSPRVYCNHLKPFVRQTVAQQIKELGMPRIEAMELNRVYQFG